jgi:quercetin dioxygenase-like cupin family protein
MAYDVVQDLTAAVTVQQGAVVSKVVHKGHGLNVSVFAFDAGEGLTEHTAAHPALVQVLSGRLQITVDGDELDADPGFWLRLSPGAPHSLVAREPTLMLLTILTA